MLRVLFVDDDPEILESYRRVFTGRYKMEFAADGPSALEVIRSGPPVDAVVADYLMPGQDGAALLADIARLRPEAFRILLTGYTDTNFDLDRVDRELIHRILSKPCLPHELAKMLDQSAPGADWRTASNPVPPADGPEF